MGLSACTYTRSDGELRFKLGLIELDCWFKLTAFQSTLHWPAQVVGIGRGGVSYVELLVQFELLVRTSGWKKQFPGVVGEGAQLLCRLFLRDQALRFGVLVDFLIICCGRCVASPVELTDLCFVELELTTLGSDMLVGSKDDHSLCEELL